MTDNAVDATLKRVTVPVYPTDPAKHLDYLEELRSHLHLLPGSIPGMPGFRHDIVVRCVWACVFVDVFCGVFRDLLVVYDDVWFLLAWGGMYDGFLK